MLRGEIAVITGAASGIGHVISCHFASSGAKLLLLDRDAERVELVAEKLRSQGTEVVAVPTDVLVYEQISAAAQKAVDLYGKIDIWCNCAGVSTMNHVWDLTEEEWDFNMDINAKGVFLCVKAAAKQMMPKGYGRIINIASIAGVIGRDRRMYHKSGGSFENLIDYAASKGGIISATRDMAAVLAPYGVRVNSISPGGFDNGCTERFQQLYGEDTPLGRMGKGGQELGCAALFLASDASSYVTGHNLVVDGGFTIW